MSTSDFFAIKPEFDRTNCLVRNESGDAVRTVYATSPSVHDLLANNDYQRMRLMSCGVKIFAKQDMTKLDVYECKWRAVNDGLGHMKRYIGPNKIVRGDKEMLKILLTEMYPPTRIFDQGFQDAVEKQAMGSFIMRVDPVEGDSRFDLHALLQ